MVYSSNARHVDGTRMRGRDQVGKEMRRFRARAKARASVTALVVAGFFFFL